MPASPQAPPQAPPRTPRPPGRYKRNTRAHVDRPIDRPIDRPAVGSEPLLGLGAPAGLAARVRLELEARRANTRWLRNPTGWLLTQANIRLWSKQREIVNSVVRHRKTTVRSAHDTGKSFTAATVTAWWLNVHPMGSAFVVTTAPTAPQVEVILWREIGKIKRMARLPGRITSGNIPKWKTAADEIIAYGRKPADLKSAAEAAQAFQGIHARYVLVIMDEACGIPDWLWNAVETIATNRYARILAIGNPDVPETQFHKTHLDPSWHSIKISAYDTPVFTGEAVPTALLDDLISPKWIQERQDDWGAASPLFTSKILGEFPEVSEETLIHPKLIQAAQLRDLSGEALRATGRYGLDVGRSARRNETACYRNRSGVIRLEFAGNEPDTMRTAGRMTRLFNLTHGQVPANIDTVGIGGGVFDRLREQGFPVTPFVANDAPSTPTARKRFVNKRAEMWWAFRKQFERGEIDLPPAGEDDKLISQLSSIRYFIRSDGRIYIESKEDMEERGLPSPDRADAAMMASSTVQPTSGDFWIPPVTARRNPRITDAPITSRDALTLSDALPFTINDLTGDLLSKKW
jgi:hypothetical protein